MRGTIVHLTTVHKPEDIRVFRKECVSLARAGYHVCLVAPAPEDRKADGVDVLATGEASGRLKRMTAGVANAIARALRSGAEVYHFHDPELIVAGVLLKGLGKRVIYDVHEDVPDDVMSKEYLPEGVRRGVSHLAAAVEWIGAVFFDRIVAATPHIARRFPARKTVVVQNFPIVDELLAVEGVPYDQRPPRAIFTGGILASRGAVEMVRAMGLLGGGCHLDLAGKFSPVSLQGRLEREAGWRWVHFHGWCARPEMARLLGQSRVGLVLFHAEPTHVHAQPNKLFEYMSAGIPVVASDFPLWREIVEGAGCGLLVDPLDVEGIAGAVRRLLQNPEEAERMGRNGLTAVRERYNWGAEARKLLEVYRQVAPQPGG